MTNENRIQIDEILKQVSTLQCNIGIDSTGHDRIVCKAKQGILLNQIKTIDYDFYKVVVP